jgi:hypothetical protein
MFVNQKPKFGILKQENLCYCLCCCLKIDYDSVEFYSACRFSFTPLPFQTLLFPKITHSGMLYTSLCVGS